MRLHWTIAASALVAGSGCHSVPKPLCKKLVEAQKGLYGPGFFYRHHLVATHRRLPNRHDAKVTVNDHHQVVARKPTERADPLMRQLTGPARVRAPTYTANLPAGPH